MKCLINSTAAGNEWPNVIWTQLGETSGNNLDLGGFEEHVRATPEMKQFSHSDPCP